MAERNSETDGMFLGLAFVGFAVFALCFVFYAIACFAALALTIVALCALDHEITLFGETITPHEARVFLGSGLAGLVGLPVFMIFCAALLQARIPQEWWPYIFLGGYSLGALGLGGAILAGESEQAAQTATRPLPPPAAPLALPSRLPSGPGGGPSANADAPAASFRFASWDDEMPDVGFADAAPEPAASQAVTIVPPAAHRPEPGRDCRTCPLAMEWTEEEIQRLAAKYAGGSR